jgi:hypothetical protein
MGFRRIALPIVAGAVGLLALGVLIVGAAPLLATVALGAAGGVVSAGAISYMSYADAHGGWGSPFNTDQSLDDWGKRALLAEGIGGVVGGVAAWVGMAAGPGVAAMFNAPNPEVVANGVGLIAGGTGGIIGQGISQTVFPSHPQQQPQSKPTLAAGKTTVPAPKAPTPRSVSRRAPSYKNRSYSHYTAPKSNWTSSYVNSSAWQQSVWNGWLSTTSSYNPSSWITYQGQQNTHYVREIAAARNGGF